MALHHQINSAHHTNTGKVRTRNEDYLLANSELGLYIVCDGVGGAAAGDVASQLAARTIANELERYLGAKAVSVEEAKRALNAAIQTAAQEVYRKAEANEACRGMCTTLEMVWLMGDHALVAHLGDGLVLKVRLGQIYPISREHTYGAEMVRSGDWTPEQAKASPFSGRLMKALGRDPIAEPDIVVMEIEPGDKFFLCSDGITKDILPSEMETHLKSNLPCSEIVQTMSNLVLSRTARDNFSLAVVEVGAPKMAVAPTIIPAGKKTEVLKSVPFFRELSYIEIAKILEISEFRDFPAGTALMKEGEAATSLLVLLRGQIEVVVKGKVVASRGPGICFGESALLTGPATRTATVRATSPVNVILLKDTAFASLLERDSALGCKVLRVVAEFLLNKLRDQTEITLALQQAQVVV